MENGVWFPSIEKSLPCKNWEKLEMRIFNLAKDKVFLHGKNFVILRMILLENENFLKMMKHLTTFWLLAREFFRTIFFCGWVCVFDLTFTNSSFSNYMIPKILWTFLVIRNYIFRHLLSFTLSRVMVLGKYL